MIKIAHLRLKNLKGWFWFCPIYWDNESKKLSPRFLPSFVLDFAVWLHNSMILFSSIAGFEFEPVYPIKITDSRWQ